MVAQDADQYSVTQVIGIQRPKPLNDFLTVPILQNYSRQRPTLTKHTKMSSSKKIDETLLVRDKNSEFYDEYSQNDFSFDVDCIGDEA